MTAGIPLVEFLHRRVSLGAFDYVPEPTSTQTFLTVDDTLPYNNFHHDFGPLNIAALFRFAVIFHDVLGQPENKGKEVIVYSYTDPRSRANAATLLASYLVLVQSWQPHQVLAPLAQVPPVMPFRDAGYSQADFTITVQDCVYGLWRAKQAGILEMPSFQLEEYEHYEMVENGDLNAVGDHFVAFASPVTGHASVKSVLKYFRKHNVQLVVRLNSPLYESKLFEQEGIKHVDLIFDDGTCPTMAFVQGFIGAAECVIRQGGKIAVHCRAGLGRTGCLIGAHLIYEHGFTASEAIAYMRFMRPGMVVGPQQHWLYQHQHEFRDWRLTMAVSGYQDPSLAGLSPLVSREVASASITSASTTTTSASTTTAASATSTSTASQSNCSHENTKCDAKCGSQHHPVNRKEPIPHGSGAGAVPHTPTRKILPNRESESACLPEPTPGQPRKPASPVRVARPSHASTSPHTPRQSSGLIYTDTNSDLEISFASDESSAADLNSANASSRFSSPTNSENGAASPSISGDLTNDLVNDLTNDDNNANSDEESSVLTNKNTSPLVMKTRNVSKPNLITKSRSVSGSRSSSRRVSSSRSSSRSSNAENTGIVMLRQRRNITDIASPQQQLALAKQLRIASNPSPHKRMPPRKDTELVDPSP